jgi:hypothetical protein
MTDREKDMSQILISITALHPVMKTWNLLTSVKQTVMLEVFPRKLAL